MARVTSISTIGWAHYTLYEALPRIHARGFRNVEIASFDSYCFHFNEGSPTAAELKEMLREYELTPVIFHNSKGRHSAWQPSDVTHFVEAWEAKMAQLPALGIRMMSMVCGERNTRDDQEEQLDAVARAYDEVAEHAKGLGIRTVLEVPHVYTIVPRPEQVYGMLDRISSDNVGILIDSSHWGVIGYDLDEYLDRIGDRLWHVHLRDSRGVDTADRKQQLELTPGDGIVDFRAFGKALDRVEYQGNVSLEFEYRDMTLEAIEAEYDAGLAHLAECGWDLPDTVRY